MKIPSNINIAMTSFVYCQVKHCKFPHFHITQSHQCGKCKQFGHGIIECGNYKNMNELYKKMTMSNISIKHDEQCCVSKCRYKHMHTSLGHKCSYCDTFGHGYIECPNILFKNIHMTVPEEYRHDLDSFRSYMLAKYYARNLFGKTEGKKWVTFCAEMGNTWYAKRNDTESNIELFFMHGDNWGQYGSGTSDVSKLRAFLLGFE
jgi:hypothetical protein